jgi:ABC-type amino acid transport substrate-binding protein
MRNTSATVLVWLVLLTAPGWSQTETSAEKAALTICLQSNNPPLSSRGGDLPSGFDLLLAQSIAQRLGRELHIQWFVSRDDSDSNLVKDANALLSDGRCQLLAEYPLLESTLERPRDPTVKLPPFDGAKPEDRKRWIKTSAVSTTRPYRLDALTIVLQAQRAGQKVRRLADLEGMKIGVPLATLSDAVAMHYENGRLIENVAHFTDSRNLFQELQAGKLDAAFVDARLFDAWRSHHDAAGLTPSGYIHSLAFNMGFVGLSSDSALIDQVNEILADLQTQNVIGQMATTAGLTYFPPRAPDVGPNVQLTALQGD